MIRLSAFADEISPDLDEQIAVLQPELLQRLHNDGYEGFFSLEPHLTAGGQFSGFSGPDLFRQASQALQGMLNKMGWEVA